MEENILQFPERPFREWSLIEASLRDALLGAGYTVEAIEHASTIIKPLFMEVWKSGNFSITAKNAEDGVKQLDFHMYKITSFMLLHLTNLAIENYYLRTS